MDDGAVSFDLVVLAMAESADVGAAQAMFERCRSGKHDDGGLTSGWSGFYERLRTQFPDRPPYGPDSPWMSMPLTVGIDHVVIHLSHSERSAPAISAVRELAVEYGLVIWDPQSRDAYLPGG